MILGLWGTRKEHGMSDIRITSSSDSLMQRRIEEETKKLYRDWYCRRNPDTLSALEIDRIRTEAGKKVQRQLRSMEE